MPLFPQDRSQSDNLVELVELGPPFNLIDFCLSHFFCPQGYQGPVDAWNCIRGWGEADCALFPSEENEHSRAAAVGRTGEMILVWVGIGLDQ